MIIDDKKVELVDYLKDDYITLSHKCKYVVDHC
jgi:hypothetical protein